MQPLIHRITQDGTRRPPGRAAFVVLAAALLSACGAGGGGSHHRTPNPKWAALTGLPADQVAGVSQTERGGLVLVAADVTAAQAAAVPARLCAASRRAPAAPGVLQPVSGHTAIRKIVVTCAG